MGRWSVGGDYVFSSNSSVVFSFSLFPNRVGSVLIILNISDLEVFQPQKIFVFGRIERLVKRPNPPKDEEFFVVETLRDLIYLK